MESPDIVTTALKTIMADPARYGLSWLVRIGTVIDPGQVILDGDSDPVSVSLMMAAEVGARMYVVTTSNGTNYLIGRAAPTGEIVVRNVSSSTFTTTPTIIDTLTANVVGGGTYRIEAFEHLESTAVNSTGVFRINVDGVQFQQIAVPLGMASVTYGQHLSTMYYPIESASVTITALAFSAAGGGTLVSFGSASYVNYLSIRDWP